jgi:hypothetical protein
VGAALIHADRGADRHMEGTDVMKEMGAIHDFAKALKSLLPVCFVKAYSSLEFVCRSTEIYAVNVLRLSCRQRMLRLRAVN